MVDTSDGTSFLQAMWEHFSLILIPALRQSQKWGPVSQQRVNQFVCSLENYVEFLKSTIHLHTLPNVFYFSTRALGAQKSIDEAVYLSLQTPVELERLSTSEGCINYAKQPDTISALEELVAQWCHQIEQVYKSCIILYTN